MSSNKDMVKQILQKGDADEKVAKAMREIDRKDFLPEEAKGNAYEDLPVQIGHGQTTSAPSIIAFMLKNLEIAKGMKVLEIGTGSGYQTALLSKLVGPEGEVVSMEIRADFIDSAKEKLAKYKLGNIHMVKSSGSLGYRAEAPFDRIIFSGSLRSIPYSVAEQLKENGRMIVPVGANFYQDLYLVVKGKSGSEARSLLPVSFVDLVEQ